MLRRYRPDPEIDRLCAGSANCELGMVNSWTMKGE